MMRITTIRMTITMVVMIYEDTMVVMIYEDGDDDI